jgi:hypothetical protein
MARVKRTSLANTYDRIGASPRGVAYGQTRLQHGFTEVGDVAGAARHDRSAERLTRRDSDAIAAPAYHEVAGYQIEQALPRLLATVAVRTGETILIALQSVYFIQSKRYVANLDRIAVQDFGSVAGEDVGARLHISCKAERNAA